MAEFVSAIVGIVAVAATTADTLQEVVSTVKDAPTEYYDLVAEVNDFKKVLEKVATARESNRIQNGDLDTILAHAQNRLQQVSVLVEKLKRDRRAAGPGNEGQRVSRLKWLMRTKEVCKLRDSLQRHKTSISNMISLATMEAIANVQLHMKAVETKVNAVVFEQRFPNNVHMDTPKIRIATPADQLLLYSEKSPKRSSTFPAQSERGRSADVDATIFRTSSDLERLLKATKITLPQQIKAPSSTGSVTGTLSLTSRDSSVPLVRRPRVRGRVTVPKSKGLQCQDDCRCACHKRVLLRSPRNLSTYMGDAFLGMQSLPWLFSSFVQCDEQTCRRSQQLSADFRYRLPSWFILAFASFSMSFALRFIPLQIFLSTRNVIPYDSPILVCIQEGDLDRAKNLFFSGKASLNDVDPYGLGVLYYASYYCWRSRGSAVSIDTTRGLIDMGAHAEWEDEIGNTALETMVDTVLTNSAKTRTKPTSLEIAALQEVALLFGKTSDELIEDYTEDRTFSPLHEVLLGLDTTKGTLEEYLSSFGLHKIDSDTIDVLDACGRTALAWAVEYGWTHAVRDLLKYGADPHRQRPSVHGKSPLLHLVIAGPASQDGDDSYLEVVRMLLRAGVDINAVDHEGWTALHVAASWNLYAVILEMASFAGDSLDWDCRTNLGETAVDLSVNGGGDEDVLELLGHRRSGVVRSSSDSKESKSGSQSADDDESEDQYFDVIDDAT